MRGKGDDICKKDETVEILQLKTIYKNNERVDFI